LAARAASVVLHMRGTTVVWRKWCWGSVAPTPWEALKAEKSAGGKTIYGGVRRRGRKGRRLRRPQPLSQNAYKVQLAKVAGERAL